MNIDKLDKIILTKEEVDDLFKWRDNHKDYIYNFKPVIEKGCIQLYMDGKKEPYHTQVFERVEPLGYTHSILFNGNILHQLAWVEHNGKGRGVTVSTKLKYSEEEEYNYNQSIISLHASIMAYMEYYSDNKEYVEVENVATVKTKKKSKNKSSKKSATRIRKKVYKIHVTDESIKMDKRRYDRKTESWGVRGHWRELKSGEKVWIKPYKKGNLEGENEPKTYKL